MYLAVCENDKNDLDAVCSLMDAWAAERGAAVRLFEQDGDTPEDKTVQVMLRDSTGALRIHEDYGQEDTAKVNVLDGCFIELGKVFAE